MWQALQEPDDGWTQYERIILRDTIVNIYKIIGDTTDRFIFVMVIECGYSQTEISRILGLSQAAISKRLNGVIKKVKEKNKKGRL